MLNFQGELPFAPTIRYSPFAAFSVVAGSHSNNSPLLFTFRYSPFAAVFRPADLPTSRFADKLMLPMSRVPCPLSHSIVSQLPIHGMRDDVAW